jgi:DNA invertase Pin-like site-specific DNA recombinase
MTAKQKPATKNEQIRQMYEEGSSVAEIATKLGIKYQRVYNVVNAKIGTKSKNVEQEEGNEK